MKRQTDPYGKLKPWRTGSLFGKKIVRIGKGKGGEGPFRFSLFPVPRSTKGLFTGYEEVNKTIRQKNIYSTNCPIFRFENKPSSGAKRKRKIKLKVQTELFKYKRGMRLEDARARGKWEGAKRGDSLFLFPLLSHRPLRRYSLTVSCDRSIPWPPQMIRDDWGRVKYVKGVPFLSKMA